MKMKKKFMILISTFMLIFAFSGCDIVKEITSEFSSEESFEVNEELTTGYDLMQEGKVEEAIEHFKKAIELNPDNEISYNNLSWAYNELGEYEKSLENIEKALSIEPNEDIEYVNQGNAYCGLEEYDKALYSFAEAIKKKKDSELAYYGKGVIYYNQSRYEEALSEFEKSLKYLQGDEDTQVYILNTLYYLGKYKDAAAKAKKFIKENSKNFELYDIYGTIQEQFSTSEEVKTYYKEVAEKFPENIEAKLLLGIFYYNQLKNNKAISYFESLLLNFENSAELHTWLSYAYNGIEDYEKALEHCNAALELDKDNYIVHNAMGDLYYSKTDYKKANDYYLTAIELLGEYNEDPYINRLYTLYQWKRYQACLDFGLEIIDKFPGNEEIPWFIGDSYIGLYQKEKAVEFYEKALKINPDNEYVKSSIARAYFYAGDLDKASEAIEECLQDNSENQEALSLKSEIEVANSSIIDQIASLFQIYYLYDFDENFINAYGNKKNLSNKEINDLINDMKSKDDQYTFFISDEIYDKFINTSEKSLKAELLSESEIYVRIEQFIENTDQEFINFIDKIEDSEEKMLIIDLRGNGGGLTLSANNILDSLLPQCTMSTLIDKDGYTYPYYSDASQIVFKQINILVDENTASASELLTLGLKTYLKNVTVIGRTTVGKGVGQMVYDDTVNKKIYLIVNHYWNVRQTNIMNKGITPDKKVEGNNLDDFLNLK